MPVSPLFPAPTPARPDLYGPKHKAMRLCLHDTLVRLGRCDPMDTAEREPALAQLDELLALLKAHLHGENAFLHTAIEARRPGASQHCADEHAEQTAQMALLAAESAALQGSPDNHRWQQLYRHLADFVAAHLRHMQVEESQHMATLRATYADDELAEIHRRLQAAIDPALALRQLRWLGGALSPDELGHWLADLQRRWPPESFLHGLDLTLAAAGSAHGQRVRARLGLAGA